MDMDAIYKLKNKIGLIVVPAIYIIVGFLPALKMMLNYSANYQAGISEYKYSIFELHYASQFYVSSLSFYLVIFLPLLIVIFSLTQFNRVIKTGFILNEIQRIGYFHSIKKWYLKGLFMSILMVFGYLIILFIVALLVPNNGIYSSGSHVLQWVDNQLVFYIILLFNNLLFVLLVYNISFAIMIRFKKILLGSIFTEIVFLVITFVLYFLGIIFSEIFGIVTLANDLYIFNFVSLDSTTNIYVPTIICLTLIVCSFLVLYILFKNKEKVVYKIEEML